MSQTKTKVTKNIKVRSNNMTTEKIKYSIECLKLVTDEFDENNVPYWLDYGTLLGAYRGSTLISYE